MTDERHRSASPSPSRRSVVPSPSRRHALAGAVATSLLPAATAHAAATATIAGREWPEQVTDALKEAFGDRPITDGRVTIEMPPIAENGQGVPVRVRAESPMTAGDHVKSLHLVSEKNPVATIFRIHLGPRAGEASIATRIRLAASQDLLAVAEMSDGRCYAGRAGVVVTLAACIDGE